MQKRLLGAASLVGVAALLMSACGGSTPTPAATGDAAATTTTPAATSTTTGAPVRDASVDLVIWSDADRATILKKYADQFGQEQGIKVQIQVSTDVRKDFPAAILLALAVGAVPAWYPLFLLPVLWLRARQARTGLRQDNPLGARKLGVKAHRLGVVMVLAATLLAVR